MVNIRTIECPKDKYNIKCPYPMIPTRIVIHNTANDAPAKNEIAYMHRNNKEISFHYAVDDVEAVQGISLDRNAWHSSDGENGKGNREGIAIEICYSKSGGERFEKAQKNAAELTAMLLRKYGWGIDKVTKHQDYANKYCPHRTLSDYGWDYFLNLVKEFLNTDENVYTVIKGDSLWSIAQRFLGDGKRYPEIKQLNGLTSDVIEPNWKLKIPTTAQKPSADPAPESTIKVGSTVRLKKGAKTYTGGSLASFVYNRDHEVMEIKGDRAVITYGGVVVAAVKLSDLTLV